MPVNKMSQIIFERIMQKLIEGPNQYGLQETASVSNLLWILQFILDCTQYDTDSELP